VIATLLVQVVLCADVVTLAAVPASADLGAQLDALVARHFPADQPGAAVLVRKGDQVLHSSRRGRANVRYEVVARPPRPRRTRREQERALRKVVRRTEGLAEKLPGGAPERPIDVASASVIDEKARATPCIQCGGDLERLGDRATSTARGVVREIALVCRRCHAPRTQWFRIVPPSPN